MDNFVDELTRHYQKRNHLASTTYCDNKVVQIYSFKINYLQTYQKITLELSKIFSYSHLYNEPVDNFVYNKRTTQASVDNFSVFSKSVFFLHIHPQLIHTLFKTLSRPLSTCYCVVFKRDFLLTHRVFHYLLTTIST